MDDRPNSYRPSAAQLRALAHPVRLRMLGILRSDGPATASGLALRLGLNSGATSYHLRQLAQAGFIAEDASLGNNRERWWRAAHQSTRAELAELDDPQDRSAHGAFRRVLVSRQVEILTAAADELGELPRAWADATTNSDWTMRLTQERAVELRDRLVAVLDEAAANEAAPDDPDTAEVTFQLHAFPRPGRLTRPEPA